MSKLDELIETYNDKHIDQMNDVWLRQLENEARQEQADQTKRIAELEKFRQSMLKTIEMHKQGEISTKGLLLYLDVI